MAGPVPRAVVRLAAAAAVAWVSAHTGGPDALAVLTAAGAWERWRGDLERRRRRPRTIGAYRTVWWAWAGFLDDRRRRWDRVGPRDLEAFLRRHPIAANTQLHYASALKVAYQFYARDQVLRTDRLAAVVLPRGGQPVPRALTLDQLTHLFQCLDSEAWWRRQAGVLSVSDASRRRVRLVVDLGYWTALRAGEIARARREHVRLAGRAPALLVPEGKGGRAGAVPLAPPIRRLLAAELGDGRGGAGPLVASLRDPGAHVSAQWVSRVGSVVLHAAGIDESLHALRHTSATLMLEANPGSVLAVSRVLRHSRSDVTEQVYTLSALTEAQAAAVGTLPDPRHR
jgi:integrase/recombinase XerD